MGLATLWDLLLGVSKKSKSLKVKRCMLKLEHDECNGSLRCSCELKHCPKLRIRRGEIKTIWYLGNKKSMTFAMQMYISPGPWKKIICRCVYWIFDKCTF